MRFRPCIDLHQGKVKQIVGATLSDSRACALRTNFEARRPAQWFARLYRRDNLYGGHVIQLGSGNAQAAKAALAAWPGAMQIGGGINADNAPEWLDAGAAAVIVTSWAFYDGVIDETRLRQLVQCIGAKRLVLDLSCRRRGNEYYVVTDRWQVISKEAVTYPLLDRLSRYCCEFLIHAVDVEGRCEGIEKQLVTMLGRWAGLPITYAGGIRSRTDIETIGRLGQGAIDFTVGSALDIFGGQRLCYADLARQYGPQAGMHPRE